MGADVAEKSGTFTACRQCLQKFRISEEELDFYKKISPRINGTVEEIPPPTLCPPCRAQRRMAHRNQIYVAVQPAAAGGQKLFTMYLGGTKFPLVSNEEWWEEQTWNPEDYGRPFDFTRPFFEQWAELRDVVPRPQLNTLSGSIDNSAYCNNAGWLKDCYFCFDAERSRECLYIETLFDSADCMDCTAILKCELCYDCAGCTNCYNLQASDNCTDCSDSWYLSNCKSCSNCFGCVNLRQKKHCIYNKQVGPDEFNAFISALKLDSSETRKRLQRQFSEFCAANPHPHLVATRAENCTGNHIHNSRQIFHSFSIQGAEDMYHCSIALTGGKSCYDCTISFVQPELMYECAICGLNVFNLAFCYNCWDGARDLLYCDTSHSSKHCFGCVCLRRRSYCILNKQYTEQEYFALLPQIINHMRETKEWGEFFPMQHSAWPYNFSFAQRYFPLSKEQTQQQGLRWLTKPSAELENLTAQELPDSLPESDEPLVARCSATGRLFRIPSEEIKRLRRFSAPLPLQAYDQRMNQRSVRCGGLRLIERKCDRTGETLLTVYSKAEAPIIWDKAVFDREFA